MDKLEALASITRLSDNVVRVLGQNPGKFTLQGTNTYLIGQSNPYTLIDTGEGRDEYIPVLESALREKAPLSDPTKPHISDIVISHWHHDHVGGLPAVLALLRRMWDDSEHPSTHAFTPPRLHKFPIPSGNTLISHSTVTLPSIIDALPPDSFTPSPFDPFHSLSDGQQLNNCHVLHTPGHTVDSICLYVPSDKALYTADTVLGQGTAVFEDLSTYLASLTRMLAFSKETASSVDILYPGHGPIVRSGADTISTYIRHRMEREEQIIALLSSPAVDNIAAGPSKAWTTWAVVSQIYAKYPENLWLPAAHGVNLHLMKLEQDGKVIKVSGEGVDTQWVMSDSETKSTL